MRSDLNREEYSKTSSFNLRLIAIPDMGQVSPDMGQVSL
jgi:hypothetical protein